MTSLRGFVAALLCSLALAAPAFAADSAQGRAAFDEGQRLVVAGDYRAALAAFEKGYLATDDAAFLLNMAQCHRLLGENKEAVVMFKLYLKSTPETANREARAVATKAIRELEAAPAAAPVVAPPPPVTAPAPVLPLAPSLPPASPQPAVAAGAPAQASGALPVLEPAPELEVQRSTAVAAEQSDRNARRLRIAGIACGATGLIAIGVGVGYRIHAGSLSDSASHAAVYDQGDYDAGKRAEKLQWIFYGTGSALLATGAALYLYGWPSSPAQPAKVSLLPVVGPGAAGLAAQGAF